VCLRKGIANALVDLLADAGFLFLRQIDAEIVSGRNRKDLDAQVELLPNLRWIRIVFLAEQTIERLRAPSM
jgi:hypothetical protein